MVKKIAKGTEMRNNLNSWLKAGYINRKQAKSLVHKVKWYNEIPVGVSIWQGTLFGAWSFILLGIEKDGYTHS